jgi:hypothetical protein
MVFSCGEDSGYSKQEAPLSIKPTTPDTNFVKLKSFFNKDSGYRQKDKPEIPFALINTGFFYLSKAAIQAKFNSIHTHKAYYQISLIPSLGKLK